METMEILGRDYPIIKHVDNVPVVDLPQMSDYKWQLQALQDRLSNPEKYRTALGEDVEATIAYLRQWLADYRLEVVS